MGWVHVCLAGSVVADFKPGPCLLHGFLCLWTHNLLSWGLNQARLESTPWWDSNQVLSASDLLSLTSGPPALFSECSGLCHRLLTVVKGMLWRDLAPFMIWGCSGFFPDLSVIFPV